MAAPPIYHRAGERFGMLTVVSKAQTPEGRTTVVRGCNLRSGNTRTCGCKKDKKPPVRRRAGGGMTFREIAEALGCSQRSVRQHFRSVLDKVERVSRAHE